MEECLGRAMMLGHQRHALGGVQQRHEGRRIDALLRAQRVVERLVPGWEGLRLACLLILTIDAMQAEPSQLIADQHMLGAQCPQRGDRADIEDDPRWLTILRHQYGIRMIATEQPVSLIQPGNKGGAGQASAAADRPAQGCIALLEGKGQGVQSAADHQP
jgi:hypothetical protein